MLRPLLSVLLLLAGAALLIASWPPGGAALPAASPPASATATLAPTPPNAPASATAAGARPIPPGYRVRVPRLNIDLPIAEGDISRDVEAQGTPEGYAFHLPGSAIPGERGNAYLYAHARAGMFLALWDARVGDEVIVDAPGGAMRYRVSEVRPRVAANDVSVTHPTDDERLTLQTSTGQHPDDPRFVVIALREP